MREYAQARAAAEDGTLIAYCPSAATAEERVQVRPVQRTGLLERVGQTAMLAGFGLLAAELWTKSRED